MASTPVPARRSARADLAPHLSELRDALNEQRRFRRDQLAELVGEISPTNGRPLDPHDEVAIALHAGATAALADIETALRRMDTGDYGRCQRCADAIAIERLEILPAAPLCMTCQHTAEAGEWSLRRGR